MELPFICKVSHDAWTPTQPADSCSFTCKLETYNFCPPLINHQLTRPSRRWRDAARSTCAPTARVPHPEPAQWTVLDGPTPRQHARAALSPARPPASPACSMSRRAALPAPLSPRSRCSRRSFCTVPTPCIMARIASTDSRLPAVAPRVCTHHHAACARAGPAKRLRLLASTFSSGERLSGGGQVVPEPGGACARPLPRCFPCERRWQRPSPRPCGRPAAARPGARPTDAWQPQPCPNRPAS